MKVTSCSESGEHFVRFIEFKLVSAWRGTSYTILYHLGLVDG